MPKLKFKDPATGEWIEVGGAEEVHVGPFDPTKPEQELWIDTDDTTAGDGDYVTKNYVDAADALRVLRAGDTMTGPLVLPGNAAAALQAVPKQQLDALAADTQAALAGKASATDLAKRPQVQRINITGYGAALNPGHLYNYTATLPTPMADTSYSVMWQCVDPCDRGPWTVVVKTQRTNDFDYWVMNTAAGAQVCRIVLVVIGRMA